LGRGLITGVTGVFTKPIDGWKKEHCDGLVKGSF